ncbi:MAG: SGNH/GDSL hydrolase family protein [Pseudomonadales bacterium]
MKPSIRIINCAIVNCAALLVVLAASTAQAITTPTSLVVFGDSLSDTGDRFILEGGNAPVAPYFNGRFSNGPNYVDVLANLLGVSSLNSLSGGTNYAVGGAEINTFDGSPTPPTTGTVVPPLTSQLDSYFRSTNGVAEPNALYIVLGGGNDLRALAAGGSIDLGQSAAALAGIVSDLSEAGATKILVPNLPNLGLTPEAQAGGDSGVFLATLGTMALNQAVETALNGLTLDANVMMFDLFGITNDIVANPAAFGFTNVTDACFDGATGVGGPGAVCANPDEYLFWDQFHPTAATHESFANRIFAHVVPIPAALPLMMSALGLLSLGVRRGRKS